MNVNYLKSKAKIKKLTKTKVSLILKSNPTDVLSRASRESSRFYINKITQWYTKPLKSLTLGNRSVFRKRIIKTTNKIKLFLKLVGYATYYSWKPNQTSLLNTSKNAYSSVLVNCKNSNLSHLLTTSFKPVYNNLMLSKSVLSSLTCTRALHRLNLQYSSFKRLDSCSLQSKITPWISKTSCSFISATTGMNAMLQFYPFLSREIDAASASFYKSWLPRLTFYQKRLGHRFFMEETIHIMHLAMKLHDASLFSSWLTSLINRISFWKTRSIFRYLLYLFKNFFLNEFAGIGCKGIKIRLKGKISAAGNSRKRRVNFKFGKVSYSTLKHKCLSQDSLISTFTGVMCLRTEIFY